MTCVPAFSRDGSRRWVPLILFPSSRKRGFLPSMRCFREITSRLFQRWLPPPRKEDDTARLFAGVFCSSRAVQRFLDMDAALFARLAANLWSAEGVAAYPHVHQDLHEALRLLAARVSARGTSRAVRQRSDDQAVEQSPPYALVFATEKFIECEHSAIPGDCPDECRERWLNAVYACRGELAIVRINMEDAGVNSPLVFDLSAMDAALDRMEMLAATLVERTGEAFCRGAPVAEYAGARPARGYAHLLADPAELQPAGAQDRGTYRPRRRTLYRPQPQGILADVGRGHRGRISYRLYRGAQTSPCRPSTGRPLWKRF